MKGHGKDAILPEETVRPATHLRYTNELSPLEMPNHPLWVCRLSNGQRSFMGHVVL